MSTQVMQWGRGAMRRLLQLDPPVAVRSEDEIAEEMNRNYSWNFAVNLMDGAFFWFGASFISATTILPLFISKLSDNPLWVALLAVLSQASWYLPQLFAAGATERVPRKKPIVVNIGLLTERLPLWLLPVAALLALRAPVAALLLFFFAYAWHGFGAGVIAPAWTDMIGRCFPVDKRGWFFGLSSFIGTGLGAISAIFSGWLLDAFPFPVNFAYAFGIAALFITVSWVFIALTREPVQGVPEELHDEPSRSNGKLKAILRKDHNFNWFLISRVLASFARMGSGFLTVAAIQHWDVADSMVAYFTVALLVGQTLGNLLAGVLADRYGHKMALEWGLWASTLGFALAWWADAPDWYYPIFLLIGVSNGMTMVSGVLIPLEFSRPENRPTYVGISNTVHGIGSMLAPLVGGLIANAAGYSWVFAPSALLGLAVLVIMYALVREPRHRPVAEI